MTVEAAEVGYLILGTALRRHVASGAPYAAVPHHLVRNVFRCPEYPTDAITADATRCMEFHRDVDAAVDYWCLLDLDHDDLCAWVITAATVADAWANGIRAELDDVDLDEDDLDFTGSLFA